MPPAADLAARLAEPAAATARRLREAGVPAEAIAAYEPPRRRFIGTRQARMRGVDRGWRLGVLLVTEAGGLLIAGETLRARTPPPVLGYTAESARARDELRHSAIRGGFAEGETVHWDARAVDPHTLGADSAPLALRDGEPVVRWAPRSPLAAAMPLAAYLDERAGLAEDAHRAAAQRPDS